MGIQHGKGDGNLLMIHYVIISNSISFNPFLAKVPVHKKGSFPLRISLINVTKSTVNGGFGHIY